MGYEDERRAGRTFLNSYKSVWVLSDHNPGTLFGNSNCSLGLQYSTKPPSSAEMTQSNLSLYYSGHQITIVGASRRRKTNEDRNGRLNQ